MADIKNFDKNYANKHINAHERALLKREMRNANLRLNRMYEKYHSSTLFDYATKNLNKLDQFTKDYGTQWDPSTVSTNMTYQEYYQALKYVRGTQGISDYEVMVFDTDPIFKDIIKQQTGIDDEYSPQFIEQVIRFKEDMEDVLKDLSSPSLGKTSDELGLSFMHNSHKSADQILEAKKVISEYQYIKSSGSFEQREEYLRSRRETGNYTRT